MDACRISSLTIRDSFANGVGLAILVVGLLATGARHSLAQPPEVEFSIEDYQADSGEHQAEWQQYLRRMVEEFDKITEFKQRQPPPALMVRIWSDFLKAFTHDNPHSDRDEELRKKALERLNHWREAASAEPSATPWAKSPEACLEHLESLPPSFGGGHQLGRVFRNEEVIEPVLVRHTPTGFSYRRCSGGTPTDFEIKESELGFFNNSLVTRFVFREYEELTRFRELPGQDYKPDGEVKLAFEDEGSILEARRLGDEHVEVTTFPPKRIAVLIVATPEALKAVEPETWEGAWGDLREDTRIEREISWWRLSSSEDDSKLEIYPPVESFVQLAGLRGDDAAAVAVETDWPQVVSGGKLEAMLARDPIILFAVEERQHIHWAKAIANEMKQSTSVAELNVGALEARWSAWRNKDEREDLKEAGSWGRYLRLVRFRDLWAIMPDRIVGKIRRDYHESPRFKKHYVILEKEPQKIQVANAIFQDQAAGMASVMDFLGCLLESEAEASSRREILEQGLRRMKVSPDDLAGLDVERAFQALFQGFSLPAGLRSGGRSFQGSISRADPEVSTLIQSLREYFDTSQLESEPSCDVALISDVFLLGPPFRERLVVVPSISRTFSSEQQSDEPDPGLPAAGRCPEAWQAKESARIALRDAIYAKAAKHTKERIKDGHLKLDKGDELLIKSNCLGRRVKKATKLFREAEEIFLKAKETSERNEIVRPKVRIH